MLESAGQDSISAESAALYIMTGATLDSAQTAYDQRRVASVTQYLKSKSDSTSINIKFPVANDPKIPGSLPLFLVSFGLKDENSELTDSPSLGAIN